MLPAALRARDWTPPGRRRDARPSSTPVAVAADTVSQGCLAAKSSAGLSTVTLRESVSEVGVGVCG
jgi:hypothetical protein